MVWAYFWAAILGGVLLSVVVEQTTGYAPWGWGAVGAVLGITAVAAFHALYLQLRPGREIRRGVTPKVSRMLLPTLSKGDLHTDYGTLLHYGDAAVMIQQNGGRSLTTRPRPQQDQSIAEIVRVVACLSLWINTLGQAARRETGVALQVLLEDLSRTTDEVLAAPTWENLRVTYLNRLPPVSKFVSASVSVYVSPQSDIVAHWQNLHTSPTDSTTLRRLACAMLEIVITEMRTVQGCQMVTVGCAALTSCVSRDPSCLANKVTEAKLLNDVYHFAQQTTSAG